MSRKIVFLLVVTFILRAALSLRDDANLTARLFNEDSFYLHTVSKNLALGKGFTIDGSQLTNGVQPLIVILNAPFYYISSPDRWLGLRLTFLLAAIIDCFSVFLVYKLLQSITGDKSDTWCSPPIVGAALWTFLYPIIAQTMNGMETGITSMLLLLSFYLYSTVLRSEEGASTLQYTFLGITLGFLVLARIDSVFVVLVLSLHQLYKKQRLSKVILIPSIAFLVSLPWWLYNLYYFGSLMPTSGAAESIGGPTIAENVFRALVTLSDIALTSVFLPFDKVSPVVQYAWIGLGILVFVFLLFRIKVFAFIKRLVAPTPVILLLIFGAVLAAYYVFVFHAPYFIPRYFQPLRIAGLLIASIVVSEIITNRWKVLNAGSKVCVVLIFTISAMFTAVFYINNFTGKGMSELYYAGVWASKKPEALVGMQQSGTAGFVADNVVNLDGKVNADVLKYMKAGKRGEYIAGKDITYIADWGRFAQVLVDEARASGARYTLRDSFRLLKIYKKEASLQ